MHNLSHCSGVQSPSFTSDDIWPINSQESVILSLVSSLHECRIARLSCMARRRQTSSLYPLNGHDEPTSEPNPEQSFLRALIRPNLLKASAFCPIACLQSHSTGANSPKSRHIYYNIHFPISEDEYFLCQKFLDILSGLIRSAACPESGCVSTRHKLGQSISRGDDLWAPSSALPICWSNATGEWIKERQRESPAPLSLNVGRGYGRWLSYEAPMGRRPAQARSFRGQSFDAVHDGCGDRKIESSRISKSASP